MTQPTGPAFRRASGILSVRAGGWSVTPESLVGANDAAWARLEAVSGVDRSLWIQGDPAAVKALGSHPAVLAAYDELSSSLDHVLYYLLDVLAAELKKWKD